MPRPIVGVGHSMGGAQLLVMALSSSTFSESNLCIRTYLSLLQPRLFHSLVLLDPVIQSESTQSPDKFEGRFVPMNTILSTHRRDIWPSRKAAAEGFQRSPFYKAWNPRVLDRWVKYGLRELPTVAHPDESKYKASKDDKPVTLATTRHQEVFTFSRPNYDYDRANEKPANLYETPDLKPDGPNTFPFYRMEPNFIFSQLPRVRPSVLYIFAGQSFMCTPSMMQDKMDNTGIGQGGSGGVAVGRVKSVYFQDKGHLLAQEAVAECAHAAVEFFGKELQRWKEEEAAFQKTWSGKSQVEKSTVDERWLKEVGPPPVRAAKTTDGNSKPKL